MSIYCVRLLVAGTGGGGPPPPAESLINPGGTYRRVSIDPFGNNFSVMIAVTSPTGVAFPVTYYISDLNATNAVTHAAAAALADFPAPWLTEPQLGPASVAIFEPQPATSTGGAPFYEVSITERAASVAAACTAALLTYANYLQAPATVQAVAAEPRA